MYYTKQFSSDDATAKPRAKDAKFSRAKMKAPGSDQDDFKQMVASNEDKMESEKWDQLSKRFHMKAFTTFLTSDPVLNILKPTLIGSLRGPVSTPAPSSDKLEGIRRITRLLQEAGFTPGTFDAHAVLECDRKHLNATCHSL